MCGNLFSRSVIASLLAMMIGAAPALAQDRQSYTKKGTFDDVRFELSNAIVAKGLVVDFNGKVGEMLARTGADVGSTKPVYKKAEYFTFCSAKLSRAMMEAEPANVALCPYVMFIYETAAKPGEITVGYRKLPASASAAGKAAISEINALLDGLARAAIK
jgi:uncharacterized protein (DUF302 family)